MTSRTSPRARSDAPRIELLVTPACPHVLAGARLLRLALARTGLGALVFPITAISSREAALRRGFRGSPAFLIDGDDPFADADAEPTRDCRVYTSSTGPSSLPSLREIEGMLALARVRRRSGALGAITRDDRTPWL